MANDIYGSGTVDYSQTLRSSIDDRIGYHYRSFEAWFPFSRLKMNSGLYFFKLSLSMMGSFMIGETRAVSRNVKERIHQRVIS